MEFITIWTIIALQKYDLFLDDAAFLTLCTMNSVFLYFTNTVINKSFNLKEKEKEKKIEVPEVFTCLRLSFYSTCSASVS